MEGSAAQQAMARSIPAECRQAASEKMRQNYRMRIQRALSSVKGLGAEGASADMPLEDNRAVEETLKECVRYWDQDKSCEKLVVVLEDGKSTVDMAGKFLYKGLTNKRDEAILGTLLSCKDLDVGFAGLCVC
jgi:hypothetical protein